MGNAVEIHKELDLRGEICPYTFVKTKLALEPMASGQVLRVLVDYEPATGSVPRSVASEGHEVVRVETAPEPPKDGKAVWEIVIKRA